jgi:hypothetical protein
MQILNFTLVNFLNIDLFLRRGCSCILTLVIDQGMENCSMLVTENKIGCSANISHGCEFGLEGWQGKYFIHMDFLKN